jgi:hypothetical protein
MSDLIPHGCKQFKQLMTVQTRIIQEHIEEHKWYRHIEDKNQAVLAFVNEYAWLMREMFCGTACPNRHTCSWGKTFLRNTTQPPTDPPPEYEI